METRLLEPNAVRSSPPEPSRLPQEPQQRPRRSLWWLWLLILGGLCYGGYRLYQGEMQKRAQASAAQAARAARRHSTPPSLQTIYSKAAASSAGPTNRNPASGQNSARV